MRKRAFGLLRYRLLLLPVLVLVAVAVVLSGNAAYAAKTCHVLIIADTNDIRIGKDVGVDADNVDRLFRANVARNQLVVRRLGGNDATASGIVGAIQDTRLASGVDTLVVFYAGHGGYTQSQGQFIAPKGQRLFRSQIRSAMQRVDARLSVLITDTCSNYVNLYSGEPVLQKSFTETTAAAFVSLCWKPTGFVDISGSKPGEVAMGNSAIGGYFTSSMCEYLQSVRDQASVDWPEVVVHSRASTTRLFRERHPSGIDAPGGRQYTQTVYDRIDLGGDNNDTTGAGVLVTRVYPNATSSQLLRSGSPVRLEVGDVIVSINGSPINTPQDFGRAVDRVGRGAYFTMQVKDTRTGQVVNLTGTMDRGGGYRFGATVDDR